MERIEPIPPRRPVTDPVMPVRRSDGATERRREEAERRRKRRDAPPRDARPPDDDGRPHVDVRV